MASKHRHSPNIANYFEMSHSPRLALPILLCLCLCFLPPSLAFSLSSLCSNPQVHRYLLISQAKVERSRSLQFSLKLFTTVITLNRTAHGITLLGNFSRLSLHNTQTGRSTIYEGRELVLKVPANHVFNLQRIPELEIQINHVAIDPEEDSPINYIMLSQIYILSEFTNRINTVVSQHIHRGLQDGDSLETSHLVKIMKGFPMLMYRGAVESYPCRTDLLCFLKKEYQLIGKEDYELIKQFIGAGQEGQGQEGEEGKGEGKRKVHKKAFKRKSLYEVHPIKESTSGGKSQAKAKTASDDEL